MKNSKTKIPAFRPTKKLGQNFLISHSIINRICEAAELDGSDSVIEVGPGYGALTGKILEKAKHLYAVEKDKNLYSMLLEKYGSYSNLELINEDILKTDLTKINQNKNLKFISNLPYNITSPVLFLLLEHRELFTNIVIMVQKEVGDRIASRPDKKSYGSLSVTSQTYFDIKKVCPVPSSAFKPRPKVESVVLKLIPVSVYSDKITDNRLYKEIVRASFSSKRKMISNSLKSAFDKADIDSCLNISGIDPKRRAETVRIEEFIKLANSFYQLQQSMS